MWHELPRNSSQMKRKSEELLCCQSVCLKCNLERQVRRTSEESPSKKLKRQCATSRARLTYMSPNSQVKRKASQKISKDSMSRKLNQYFAEKVTFDEEQNEELNNVMTVIKDSGKKAINGAQLQLEWYTFYFHALVLLLRLALVVFTCSPTAYDALKSFSILQLPSRSTLLAYKGAFLHQCGANHESIADQVAQFIVCCKYRRREWRQESKNVGVLIFDEVKVMSRLIWNSRSQTIIGLCMTHDQQSSLSDIYQLLSNESKFQQTSYILQFLWRDLAGDFDIIGPYFTSSKTLESKFIYSCVMETVKLFHLHGLKTLLLVCDGTSVNLTTLKATHSHFGVYPITSGDDHEPFKVSPKMLNPFDPPNHIHWMICPSHQLKNIINKLFSLQQNGTKDFTLKGVEFGWETIVSLYKRVCERVSKGLTRMVYLK
ncbi:PREDICTED: uncharacterized protein LOC109580475 [Amphimedon queenslandica]|uniref:Transposable element P transposase-like RNase H domain-containing protein n=2 Tax=Amphimedon queenslandica TaxID=400682 RepID=A0AAN0IXJ8_AMPQE|nr:PREDICTED: uncharacterized protein LOC109580475 [Amphimedon queenslandica]|eukprot:XP_019849272.1 PREDICTED: uncharacterized protein LOC109580475 [Amphimedon queenslandica]